MKSKRNAICCCVLILAASINSYADVMTEEDMPTEEELNKYPALIAEYGLGHQDIESLKLTFSAPDSRLISPDKIKSLNLGSPIFTSTSTFDYGSIFDGSVLNKAGLINTLDGDSKVRSEVQVTANTRKSFDTSQVKGSGQAAVQWGGFRSNIGYLHENAQQKSSLTGEVTANAYQYLTKQISLKLNTGNDPIEMSQYARGEPFDIKQLDKYITTTEIGLGFIGLGTKYTKVTVNSIYEGKGQDNPRAHLEFLALLEGKFNSLNAQYYSEYSYANEKETILRSSQEDMRALRKAINQSIQAFYDKYGDSFTSKLYGYNQVRASAKMIKNEITENNESNNALSIGVSYGGFVAGVQSQVDVQWYKKKAFEENRNSLTVKAEAEPASDANLSAWEDKVLKFLKEVNPTLSVPTDVVTKQGVPSLPAPKELRYDPSMPPGVTLAKYDDYLTTAKDYKDRYKTENMLWTNRGKALVNFALRKNQQAGAQDNNVISESAVAIERNSSIISSNNGQDSVRVSVGAGRLLINPEPMLKQGMQSNAAQKFAMISSLLADASNTESPSPTRLERELRREFQLLRKEGRRDYRKNHLNAKMTAAQVRRILNQQADTNSDSVMLSSEPTVKAMLRSAAESQFVGLSGTVIAGFDVAPYAAHLAVLRPNLTVPGDPNPSEMFGGFPNMYDLGMLLHNYEIIDTYLSFISRFEISGLKNRNIAPNYSKFFSGDKATGYKGFQQRVMDLVEVALVSGKDIPSSEVSSLLQSLIFGRVTNEVYDYKTSELFKLLGNDGFNYVMSLLDQKVSPGGKWSDMGERRLDIIRRAPGGYIPVKLDAKQNPFFVSNTKALKAPAGGLFDGEWTIQTDTIPLENGFDLSRLYTKRNQSPLYPVFAYNDKSSASLLFIQFAGSSVLVYGRNQSLYPYFECDATNFAGTCGSLTSIESILPTIHDAEVYNLMRNPDNGFDVKKMSFEYSLIYPKASDEDNRINALRNNALVLGLDGSPVDTPDAKPNRYALGPTTTLLEAFKTEGKVELANTLDALDYDLEGNDKISKYNRVDLSNAPEFGTPWGFIVMLPVDSQLLTQGRFDSLFTYSNDTTPAAIYGQRPDGGSGFNGGIIRAMLK